MSRLVRWLVLLACLTSMGCATVPGLETVPARLADTAEVNHLPNIRMWGDLGREATRQILENERAALIEKYKTLAKSDARALSSNILALSGGADDGAFGAGLLVGWGERGDRPSFDLVTGISSGALIAPFAFLGREYDRQLSEIFTKHSGEDIYQAKILAGLMGGAAVADNAPLARLIASYTDKAMLARIAAERAKGRYLLVGTTNINAQRPVFWDMGRIAQSKDPRAIQLFRKVLLASAALPGIFPPVEIEVTAGGRIYKELHVDGGPTREVFFSPAELDFRAIDKIVRRKIDRRVWVIRNGKITPEYAIVDETALSIAARSLETLIKSQGVGDLIRMYETARSNGMDYNLAYIPGDFKAPRPKPFEQAYMRALYAFGHTLGKSGYSWSKTPPGVSQQSAEAARGRKDR